MLYRILPMVKSLNHLCLSHQA